MTNQHGKERPGHSRHLVGMVQTVLGPIPSEQLGVTTTHEHLLVDLSSLQKVPVEASRRAKFYAPVSIELLGSFNYGGQTNLDNSRLLDVETAIGETTLFKRAGGDTIVEATSIGIGRDPDGLRQIARATGLNIVMGASYYVGASHPPDMGTRSEEDIVDENRRPDEIRREAESHQRTSTDTTQTFGHDSDLSFVPFGSELVPEAVGDR